MEKVLTKYSAADLKEFESIISDKLDKARQELAFIKGTLSRGADEGAEKTTRVFEDSANALERENLSKLATRQHKFISQLEASLIRIKNGTYGICMETGQLIDKERLKAVPHTTLSIEAKLNRK